MGRFASSQQNPKRANASASPCAGVGMKRDSLISRVAVDGIQAVLWLLFGRFDLPSLDVEFLPLNFLGGGLIDAELGRILRHGAN